jgi:predicted O-methyltransferase YrrM
MEERKVKVIVEAGTARCGDTNFDGDGGSTILFGHWAVDHDAKMYSVDISQSHIDIATKVTLPYLSHLSYVLSDSAAFLQSFEGKIDFLYLDSWDYSETDPEPAQIHNLKEVTAALDKLHDNSIVMIDDCNVPGGGKGKLAIAYMVEKGWRTHINRHHVILLKN